MYVNKSIHFQNFGRVETLLSFLCNIAVGSSGYKIGSLLQYSLLQ